MTTNNTAADPSLYTAVDLNGSAATNVSYSIPINTATTNGYIATDNTINWGGGTIPINTGENWMPNTITIPSPIYYDNNAIYEARIKQLEDKLTIIESERAFEKSTILWEAPAWITLTPMLQDMRSWVKNGGEKIVSADDLKNSAFGFICLSGYRKWSILMSNVRTTEQQMFISDGKAVVIPECFYTAQGKEYLLEVINAK